MIRYSRTNENQREDLLPCAQSGRTSTDGAELTCLDDTSDSSPSSGNYAPHLRRNAVCGLKIPTRNLAWHCLICTSPAGCSTRRVSRLSSSRGIPVCYGFQLHVIAFLIPNLSALNNRSKVCSDVQNKLDSFPGAEIINCVAADMRTTFGKNNESKNDLDSKGTSSRRITRALVPDSEPFGNP